MPIDTDRLRRLAQHAVATRPRLLLATALAEETDASLAAALGCDVATVLRLRLCYPPRPDRWAADVAQIAEALACDAARLAALLQRLP